jgi:hypothetical protein
VCILSSRGRVDRVNSSLFIWIHEKVLALYKIIVTLHSRELKIIEHNLKSLQLCHKFRGYHISVVSIVWLYMRFKVHKAVITKIIVFSVVTPCRLVHRCKHVGGTCCLFLQCTSVCCPRDRGSKFLWNVVIYLPTYLPTYYPPTYLPTHLPTYTPIYLSTHPPTHPPPTYLPTYPPTYLPIYIPTYPPTYLPIYLSVCLQSHYLATVLLAAIYYTILFTCRPREKRELGRLRMRWSEIFI